MSPLVWPDMLVGGLWWRRWPRSFLGVMGFGLRLSFRARWLCLAVVLWGSAVVCVGVVCHVLGWGLVPVACCSGVGWRLSCWLWVSPSPGAGVVDGAGPRHFSLGTLWAGWRCWAVSRLSWWGVCVLFPGRGALRRSKEVQICTGLLEKKTEKYGWYILPNTHLFSQQFVEAGMGLKKVSFSTRLYKRNAFSHFLIRDLEDSQSRTHHCGRMELFMHILNC